MQTLTFKNTTLSPVKQDNQIWLTSADLANALGYSRADSVTRLYNENADEFTPSMTQVIETTCNNLKRKIRIFSLKGCHLIAMFARTKIAKEFRQWVLDILDKEVGAPALKNPTLSENQAYRLKRAVELKCKDNRLHYQTIWTALKNHFGKTSYKDILAADFDEAMTFIANFGFGSFLANVDMVELHDALADCAVLLREYNCMMQMLINFGYAGTNLYGTKNPMYQPGNCLHRLMRLANALNLKTCDGVPMFTHDSINFYHGKSHHIVA